MSRVWDMRVTLADPVATLRVLHIDSHPSLCVFLEQLLQASRQPFAYSACHCFATALEAIGESEFDLIVLDPSLGGNADLRRIKTCSNAAKTIIWSQLYTYGSLRTALEFGASGYIGKHEPAELLGKALETVHSHGALFVSKQGQQILAAGGLSPHTMPPGYQDLSTLSGREMDVLDLLARGCDTKTIARQLNIKRKTIDTFRYRIREKLELNSSHELVVFALSWHREGRPLYMRFESESVCSCRPSGSTAASS